MSPLPPQYAHVLGLGLLWTSVHCASMCGPLLCGLHIGGAHPSRRTSALRGIVGVLTYQAGRGLTYAWLGGLAGLIGAGLSRIFTAAGGVLSLCFGVALLLSAVRAKHLVPLRRPSRFNLGGTALNAVQSFCLPLLESESALRELALGALFGLLPCMIPAWALGQAALTSSPVHGAAIMLLLVLLTTPMLLIATQLPRLGLMLPQRLRSRVANFLPMV